jgi:hypothetical protein
MNRSEQINELAAAFAKAQAALPAVPKRGKGQVGQARTTYATLDDVIDTVRGPLSENGLSFTQMLDAATDGPALTTMLLHESGQWMASSTPIDAMDGNRGTNAMQAFGSTLTYLKRYALSAMLGVTTDDDDDGSAATRKRQAPTPEQRQAPTPPPVEEPQDTWEQEEQWQANGSPAQPFLDVSEVGVFDVKAGGKPHVGLMTDGHKYPDIRWWKGRTELLTAAPWLADTCTKDVLTMGTRFPFAARVYYTMIGKYKVAQRFEQLA